MQAEENQDVPGNFGPGNLGANGKDRKKIFKKDLVEHINGFKLDYPLFGSSFTDFVGAPLHMLLMFGQNFYKYFKSFIKNHLEEIIPELVDAIFNTDLLTAHLEE